MSSSKNLGCLAGHAGASARIKPRSPCYSLSDDTIDDILSITTVPSDLFDFCIMLLLLMILFLLLLDPFGPLIGSGICFSHRSRLQFVFVRICIVDVVRNNDSFYFDVDACGLSHYTSTIKTY
jgi:hypothetical protein